MTIKLSSKGAAGGGIAPWFNGPKTILEYVAGRYYGMDVPAVEVGGAYALGKVVYVPFVPVKDHTFTALAHIITGNENANKSRFAIYDEDGGGNPGALKDDLGEITYDATIGVWEIAHSIVLVKDTLYFIAGKCEDAISCVSVAYSDVDTTVLPSYGRNDEQMTAWGKTRLLYEDHAYSIASMPATAAPTGVYDSALPAYFLKG